ncbi:hypothetical protein D3C72_1490320 [compost metagenome]
MAGRHLPGPPGADRYLELLHQHACGLVVADAVVEGLVHLQGGALAGLVGGWIVLVHVLLLDGFLTRLIGASDGQRQAVSVGSICITPVGASLLANIPGTMLREQARSYR